MSEYLTTRLFFAAFGAGALLDLVVESFGLAAILGTTGVFSAVVCMALAFACFCLRFGTPRILASPRHWLGWGMRGAWLLAVLVSLFALVNAVGVHVLAKQPLNVTIGIPYFHAWGSAPWPLKFIGAVIVLYLAAAPVFLAYLVREHFGRGHPRPPAQS